jgi:hypothetical protein
MRVDLKWHEYPGLSSSHRLDDLVQEIDIDPLAFLRMNGPLSMPARNDFPHLCFYS